MSKPVVLGFVSKRRSEERPVIVAQVMDHNFLVSFSTPPDKHFSGKGFQRWHGDIQTFDRENPKSRNLHLCRQTCSPRRRVPAGG